VGIAFENHWLTNLSELAVRGPDRAFVFQILETLTGCLKRLSKNQKNLPDSLKLG
jgi:hypothetical protein